MDMDITGSATRYDDVILYEFRYRGTGTSLSYKYTVKESEVKCVAKANEEYEEQFDRGTLVRARFSFIGRVRRQQVKKRGKGTCEGRSRDGFANRN